jgi:twitching motility protein PilI
MNARDTAPDRRTRLRAYQEQLLERMQDARATSAATTNRLGVRIGAGHYLLDLLEVGEIVPAGAVTRVPLTQPWYLGLANVRGNLVGVIDLAAWLGEAPAVASAPAPALRMVTFAPSLGVNCALLVARVHGLRHAADMTQADGRLRDPDGNEWVPLSLAALVRDERFMGIGL